MVFRPDAAVLANLGCRAAAQVLVESMVRIPAPG
jgi:hypothetical protein